MIIACPNCGAALELPEESVGAKVQCPICETSFVSAGPQEWEEQTIQRLNDVMQSFTEATKWNVHIIMTELAGVRFEYAPFRLLEVKDVIESPLGLMAVVDCMSTSAAALTSKLSRCDRDDIQVWKDLPGRHGVGVLLRGGRSDEGNKNGSANFESIRTREEWQRLSSDGIALPALLGVDFLNRDLVLNLADFNCLYITGGDTHAQTTRLNVIMRGIVSCRDESQVCIQKLDFMGTLFHVPQKFAWANCETHLNDDRNKNWKRDAANSISKIEMEVERRKKLFERSGVDEYGEYCCKHKLPRLVLIVEADGKRLNESSHEIFNRIVLLLESDLRSYGIHLILVDYGPFISTDEDAFPTFVQNPDYLDVKDGLGCISGRLPDPLMSLVAFGTTDATRAGFDDDLVYRSPNGEVCKFRLAKSPK